MISTNQAPAVSTSARGARSFWQSIVSQFVSPPKPAPAPPALAMPRVPMAAPTNAEVQPIPPCAYDPAAPIIIIGAGRSGSTLLVRILNAHPELNVMGETNFLAAGIWNTVWNNRFWHQWQQYLETRPNSFNECTTEIADHNLQQQIPRVANLCARFMAALVQIRPSCHYWGFKEIWNGSSSHQFAWETYDLLFPQATWLHIVRHPMDFLGSYLGWNQCDNSVRFLQERLDDWLTMVQKSRERAATGRFFEVRYENLKQAPQQALQPVFDRLGIAWTDSCGDALKEKVLGSKRDRVAEQKIFAKLRKSRDLLKVAAEYDYSL